MPREYNVGLHSGLLDAKHIEALGKAVWLFLWCVRRQTDNEGWVLGGKVITARSIAGELNLPLRTVQRWLGQVEPYVEISRVTGTGLRLRVKNQKKFDIHCRRDDDAPPPPKVAGPSPTPATNDVHATKVAGVTPKVAGVNIIIDPERPKGDRGPIEPSPFDPRHFWEVSESIGLGDLAMIWCDDWIKNRWNMSKAKQEILKSILRCDREPLRSALLKIKLRDRELSQQNKTYPNGWVFDDLAKHLARSGPTKVSPHLEARIEDLRRRARATDDVLEKKRLINAITDLKHGREADA